MRTIHAVMRPQDFRANRLMLLFNELAAVHDLRLTVIHNTNGESCPSCAGETGWTLPFREISFSFDALGQSEGAKALCADILGERLGQGDLLLISCEHFLPLLPRARELGLATWYDQREMFLFGVGGDIRSGEAERLDAWERRFLPHADFVTTVDSHEEFWKGRYETLGRPCHVIRGVPPRSPDLIAHSRGMIEERDIDGRIELVMIGGIRINQGLEALLDGLELLPQSFNLHLIGLVNPAFRKTFEALLAHKANPELAVHYGDWMPYDGLVRTIARFHVGLMLKQPDKGQYGMIARGNSRKPFTYMHAGLPCIAPHARSVCLQVAEEGAGLRVDVARPQALAEAITAIIQDRKTYDTMAMAGIDAIERTYNWENEWLGLREAAGRALAL
ncbi:MAG: hypothetical protein ABIK45_04440 [Pseudomonadota bacterium]